MYRLVRLQGHTDLAKVILTGRPSCGLTAGLVRRYQEGTASRPTMETTTRISINVSPFLSQERRRCHHGLGHPDHSCVI